MKLEHSVRYAAPPHEVYAMLTNPAFREKASREQRVDSVEVTVDGGSVRIEMLSPNDDVPAFARRFAGDTIRVVQEETWRDGEVAEFSLSTPGKPAGIDGVRRLVSDDGGTLDTFEGEARAKVPVIGGKIESLIGDRLTRGWDIEHRVGTAWLEGDR